MGTIKDGDELRVYTWMIYEFKNLREAYVYAVVFRDSFTEKKGFSGDLQYLADWTHVTKRTATKYLNSLIEKGYVRKEDDETGVKYSIVPEKVPEEVKRTEQSCRK